MVTIITSMEVKNFTEFRKAFDTHEQKRKQAGIKVVGLHRSVDSENHVTVITEAADAKVAKEFMTNPEMKTTFENAGVISQPDIKILNKVQ
jgi:quinol monooxygenase YgiN